MREDYQALFNELLRRLAPLNPIRDKQDELYAEVSLSNGWSIGVEGERLYGPTFTIYLIPRTCRAGQDGYAVWLLMRLFAEMTGRDYGPPNIEGQVNFLILECDRLFFEEHLYKLRYDELNAGGLGTPGTLERKTSD